MPYGPAGRSNAVHVLLLLPFVTQDGKGLGSFQLLGLLERLRILGLFRVFGCHLVALSVRVFDYNQRPYL
jgi:hypothetical protein